MSLLCHYIPFTSNEDQGIIENSDIIIDNGKIIKIGKNLCLFS